MYISESLGSLASVLPCTLSSHLERKTQIFKENEKSQNLEGEEETASKFPPKDCVWQGSPKDLASSVSLL